MKPYQQMPIVECGEPLVAIPIDQFALEQPHPYIQCAAPYGDKSPYYLRQGVLKALVKAQQLLQHRYPDWQIQIFDAYRPLAVQQYMVDYTFAQVIASKGLTLDGLRPSDRHSILEEVYQFWAVPSSDPATPPPHSTGAAVDVTLVTDAGDIVDMGSPIDELSPRSYPDHFASQVKVLDSATEPLLYSRYRAFHRDRQLLKQIMTQAGFRQHPREWWHFSLGDQMWAWLLSQENVHAVAKYGAV